MSTYIMVSVITPKYHTYFLLLATEIQCTYNLIIIKNNN